MKIYEDANGYRNHDHDAFDRAAEARERGGDQLLTLAERVNAFRGSALDRLERVREVELQAEAVRRALVAEARAVGYSWKEIAATLGTTERKARRRYRGGVEG